jgi:2-oxoglutarate dehydrogenase complex dehydrogenase (E1) component-like enzyme
LIRSYQTSFEPYLRSPHKHSSARLERFLQLAAENNSTVVNLSSASNYFHLLRAQAASLDSQEMRPLIVMSPKSLLRNKTVAKHKLTTVLLFSAASCKNLSRRADECSGP